MGGEKEGSAEIKSPIFLQWLDAVWQILRQHPTAFEFNEQYIIKLAQHTYSDLFGTFMFNSESERLRESEKRMYPPVSIWQFLDRHNEDVVNILFDSSKTGRLAIKFGVQNLCVWREFYCIDSTGNTGLREGTPAFSSSVLPRTAATYPLKDVGAMQKSKSSESISSLGNPDAIASGALDAAHSESNGNINSLNGGDHHLMETSPVNSGIFRRDTAKTRSLRSRKSNIKDLVDNDGLVKFHNPSQEEVRKRLKQLEADIKMRNTKITNTKKDRSSSEKTQGMSGSSGGWTVGQDDCALCHLKFSSISLKQEDRRHHCRYCGRTVCNNCSKHTMHAIHEGRGVQQRVCKLCYDLMLKHPSRVFLETGKVEGTETNRDRKAFSD